MLINEIHGVQESFPNGNSCFVKAIAPQKAIAFLFKCSLPLNEVDFILTLSRSDFKIDFRLTMSYAENNTFDTIAIENFRNRVELAVTITLKIKFNKCMYITYNELFFSDKAFAHRRRFPHFYVFFSEFYATRRNYSKMPLSNQ